MTVRGWCVLSASMIAIAVGMVMVNGALAAGGLMGLLVLLGARIICRRNAGSLIVERSLPESCFAGDAFKVCYLLKSSGRRTAAIHLVDTLAPDIRGVSCLFCDETGSEAVAEAKIGSRGVVTSADAGVRSDFPLGLFEASRWLTIPSRMTVFPRPLITKSMIHAQETLDAHVLAHSSAFEGSDQFRSIREFRPGDPVTRIHWPATSRAGGVPMVCEYDPPAPQPSRFEVIFHSYSPAGHLLRPRAFETALSMVAGFFVHAHQGGIEVSFASKVNDWIPVTMDPRSGSGEALEILACARYRPERSPDQLLNALAQGQMGASVRTFVVSDTPVEHWVDLLPPLGQPLVCLDTKGTYRKVFRFRDSEEKGSVRLRVNSTSSG